ncbi:hypothetical protein SRHO_G00208370 [Serrasalmus rhombeus]
MSLWVVAFSSVWIVQWSAREKYEVGDLAVLHCNISSHQETLRACKISWAIQNPIKDTEELLCTASCVIDGTLRKLTGNGTTLIITERKPEPAHPWLKYLLFSVNLLVLLIATLICALIIRKRKQ